MYVLPNTKLTPSDMINYPPKPTGLLYGKNYKNYEELVKKGMARAMDAIINLVKLFKTSVQLVALTEYKAVSVNVFITYFLI